MGVVGELEVEVDLDLVVQAVQHLVWADQEGEVAVQAVQQMAVAVLSKVKTQTLVSVESMLQLRTSAKL